MKKINLLLIACVCMPSIVLAQSRTFTLDMLVERALTSYPSVQEKESRLESAKSDKLAAVLKFLPAPSISTQRQRMTPAGSDQTTNNQVTNITISQPLFLDGGIIAGYDRAKARVLSAQYALLETKEDITKRVVNAYADWQKANLKIAALQDSVEQHEKYVALISRRMEAEVSSGADKDLARSRLSQVKSDLVVQRSAEQVALATLTELVAFPLQSAHLTNALAVDIPERTQGIAQITAGSPILLKAQYEAEAAQAEAREIRASAIPQVMLQAQRQIGNAYVPGAPGFETVGVVLQYAPGGGIGSVATTGAAFDRARAATMMLETARRELANKLVSEYNDYEYALQRKKFIEESAALSSELSQSYDRQYLVGRKSWLDLMNSMRERVQTKMALADLETNLMAVSRRIAAYINSASHEVNKESQ